MPRNASSRPLKSCPTGVAGFLRGASPDETELLADWRIAFSVDADQPVEERADAEAAVARLTGTGSLRVWDDGGPVSCLSMTPVGGIGRIGFVYTPPAQRGRGYASAAVAARTAEGLAAGQRVCLFTDLANPTSNHIYQQVGFRPVADFCDHWFD